MTARARERHFVRTALVLVLPIAFFGCGSAPGDDDVAVSSDAVQARTAGYVADRPEQSLVLPLDAYAFSAEEDQVIGEANEAAARACFEAHGFEAAAADPLPFGASADTHAQRHDRRYSVADAEVAATYGYHPPDTTDVRREFYEAHSDDELEVLVGTDADGGCLGQASAVTAARDEASLRAGEELVSGIQAEAWHGALGDPRVLEVFAAWSACMAEDGYRYEAPMQANDDPAWWRTEAAGAEEIATATADVACKEATGVIPMWSAVEAEYQAELIARNESGLEVYRGLLDQQVSQARAALH